MRPLELRLRNFRSYREPEVVFDLRGRSLVGVVGPIGSGKSSLLDGIAFALYGKTPTEGQATTRLIHQRAGQGGVNLRFEVGGEVWEAVRVLRRKGQSQHALYRYDEDTPEAQPVEKVTLEREVNERVRRLLGLDFDTFGRSVFLAQGRFAEFLSGQPADRDKVLKGVFGHDRIDSMREVARTRSAELAAHLAGIDGQLVQIEALEGRLAGKVAELAETEARLETLAKAEHVVEDLDARVASAKAGADQARSRRRELEPLGGQLPTPEAVAEIERNVSAIGERRVELFAAMEGAAAERKAADHLLSELNTTGEQDLLMEADKVLAASDQAKQRLADADTDRELRKAQLDIRVAEGGELATSLEAAAQVEGSAEQEVAAAAQVLEQARSVRHDVSHHHMATELRQGISAGEPCPVCLRLVEDPPQPDAAPDLDAAKHSEDAAEVAWRAAVAARDEARGELVRLQARATALGESVTQVESELRQLEDQVASRQSAVAAAAAELLRLLGDGDPGELIGRRRQQVTDLRNAAEGAHRRFEAARDEHERVIAEEKAAQGRIDDTRRGVDRVWGRLGMDGGVEGTFGVQVAMVRETWSAQIEQAGTAADAADAELAAATVERADLMADLGVPGDFRDTLFSTRVTTERLVTDIAAEREEIGKADSLRSERATTNAVKADFDRIVHDLTDSRFVRYLLDDERARLADLGGEHFMRLTSGRYRFTADGQFDVVDLTAADTVRKASSLSGGETFLASLALALALAEMVTRTGGRLDAFFLDEGFGSLDPEHLDLAMEGIEELVVEGSSRLVVVVSHLPELRDRIGDLIQLDRDPLTGDTRVMRA